MLTDTYVPEYCRRRVLVLGCGNILFGDDGFGPKAIEYLRSHYELPDDVFVLDVGTGVRDVLFTLALSSRKPQELVIIDIMDAGRKPGEILVAHIEDLPPTGDGAFSLHHVPTITLLQALRDCYQLDILVVVVQPQTVPETVRTGLSPIVNATIPWVCQHLVTNWL
jgi:coenzyme F420 hydrogenase subunit delta